MKVYNNILETIGKTPRSSRILLIFEKRGLYIPRRHEIADPGFQEKYFRNFPASTADFLHEIKDFDYILVDCPAGIEQGFQNAVAGATEAIVVTTPEMSAVRDADRIIGLLEAKEEIESYKLLLNRVRPNLVKSKDMMSVDDVVEILSTDLIGIIPEDTGIITSTNKGEPVVNDDKSLAGRAYQNVARRIMGEDVEFLDLEEETSVVAKVKKFFKGLVGKEK